MTEEGAKVAQNVKLAWAKHFGVNAASMGFTASEQAVLWSAWEHADNDGTRIFPGREALSKRTGVSVNRCGSALAKAVANGLMHLIAKEDSRNGKSREYALADFRAGAVPPMSRDTQTELPRERRATEGVQRATVPNATGNPKLPTNKTHTNTMVNKTMVSKSERNTGPKTPVEGSVFQRIRQKGEDKAVVQEDSYVPPWRR